VLWIDELGALGGAILVEHRRDGNRGKTRVADVGEHVGVSEFLRLDHGVQRVGRMQAPFAEREALHEIEHHQRGDACVFGPTS